MFSLTTPIGIILGIIIQGISPIFRATILAITAGTFLYISASEVIIEEFSVSNYKIEKFAAFVIGAVIITIFTLFEYPD
jgi:zinc transporter ZupT